MRAPGINCESSELWSSHLQGSDNQTLQSPRRQWTYHPSSGCLQESPGGTRVTQSRSSYLGTQDSGPKGPAASSPGQAKRRIGVPSWAEPVLKSLAKRRAQTWRREICAQRQIFMRNLLNRERPSRRFFENPRALGALEVIFQRLTSKAQRAPRISKDCTLDAQSFTSLCINKRTWPTILFFHLLLNHFMDNPEIQER